MNRNRAILSAALGAAALLALPHGLRSDDRDFLRRGTEAPLVFILLDTSSSMALTTKCTAQQLAAGDCRQLCTAQNGNCFAPRNGDDPASKLYQAKEVISRVLQRVTDMNIGFASFNQDNIRVVRKHWLYRVSGGQTVALTGGETFPALGALEVFGESWQCVTGTGDAAVACNAANPAEANNAWEMTRFHRVPKPGATGQNAVDVFVQSGNGANAKVYKVTYTHLAGEILGAATFRTQAEVRECVSGNCNGGPLI